MAKKQGIGRGIKLFLVTSGPTSYQDVCRDHYSVPTDELSMRFHRESMLRVTRDNRYIRQALRAEIELPVIIYEDNFTAAREYLDKLKIEGLVIPVGHGDMNTVRNLGFGSPEEVGIPVFEAHLHYPGYRGYEGHLSRERIAKMNEDDRIEVVHSAFKEWITKHFRV